ncbi:DEAD/DEAH box helicase [Micrococcus sp. FDAARGOS_333]|uniref:DEAD/DEAH box helicase n=1 Tax=Micrococcus sp. FDAARGOS_333 TaxID=1930558 RepID=UPI000B4E0FF4|nr:DEAD/DEAH box helicase [Micrococcus sp. FDAARGOS_333]PNL16781.1 DUF3427 domain-containing protein [Micrococcus sp. FDAARGOS_333]
MSSSPSSSQKRQNDLVPGVYERLETRQVAKNLKEITDLSPVLENVADDALPRHLAVHLAGLIEHAFSGASARTREEQLALAARVVDALGPDYGPDEVEEADNGKVRVLHELQPKREPKPTPFERPQTPFSDVALLTNGQGEPSIGSEIRFELASSDRVDLLCAFVKWHGLRTLEKELTELRDRGIPFRVITTTYVGATERRALDRIVRDFGGEVRVNYTTASTRLHAKAWLFHRDSGLSTAYVGSSNLSKAAMLDGLEWNVRLSQIATPALIRKFQATFESYWGDKAFELYNPDTDAERLDDALRSDDISGARRDEKIQLSGLDVTPRLHQQIMLDDLNAERRRGHHRNLLVAATGTGKTVMAALDYRDLTVAAGGRRPRLLFVAHRKEILDQALHTYREVLKDGAFGELYVDGHKPTQWKHVFASVQSLKPERVQSLAPAAFSVVVIDEFHHAAAPSYSALLVHLQPHEVLGLTATPERTDGTNVKDLFGGRIASELRLWDALADDLLVPFHYFGISDDVDLTHVEWRHGQYDHQSLSNVYTGNDARAGKIIKAIEDKVSDLDDMRALAFCVTVEHAKYMADKFNEAGIPAAVVIGETHSDERASVLSRLATGELKIVCGVDVFNEGVDIPTVNTVLFLRPTQSATIFLQQLGRGLRRAPGKAVLTALDFVGHQRAEFRFDLKLRALTGSGRKRLVDDLHHDFPYLPAGSQIVLDEVARDHVLSNIRQQINMNAKQLAQDIRVHAGRRSPWEYRLREYLDEADRSLADVMRPGANGRNWTTLREQAAGAPPWGPMTDEERRQSLRAITLRHVDDAERAEAYTRLLTEDVPYDALTAREQQFARMLYFTAIHDKKRERFTSFDEGLRWARQQAAFVEEATQLLECSLDAARTMPEPLDLPRESALLSHAHYRREEILAGLDIATWDSKQSGHREGVAWSSRYETDAFLVTLKKDESRFSPTTMYRDFAVSPSQFHWESQSRTRAQSPQGQRYLAKQRGESNTLMFVRNTGSDDIGEGAAFLCLGTLQFHEWSGTERPMQITWELDREMPAATFAEASAAG